MSKNWAARGRLRYANRLTPNLIIDGVEHCWAAEPRQPPNNRRERRMHRAMQRRLAAPAVVHATNTTIQQQHKKA